MFFSLIKKINGSISKRVSNIYLKVTIELLPTFSKLRFSKFMKFVSRSVFLELQLTQVSLNFKTSCSNLKIRGLEAKLCMWLFCYLNFERNYDLLNSKSSCILFNESIYFNKNETESKMENPTHTFRKTNLVLQFI